MPSRKLPADDVLVGLYEEGKSSGEIVEMFGCAPCTVSLRLKRAGYKVRTMKEAAELRKRSGRWSPSRSWLGKKQPPEMVEKRIAHQRGENHYLWKGGISLRPYRNLVEKKVCSHCGITEKLSIHHINFDHYDNSIENLQVVCLSCHSSIHKQSYWDAIHGGYPPPVSNAPVGWRR